jgi:hypothetical protein
LFIFLFSYIFLFWPPRYPAKHGWLILTIIWLQSSDFGPRWKQLDTVDRGGNDCFYRGPPPRLSAVEKNLPVVNSGKISLVWQYSLQDNPSSIDHWFCHPGSFLHIVVLMFKPNQKINRIEQKFKGSIHLYNLSFELCSGRDNVSFTCIWHITCTGWVRFPHWLVTESELKVAQTIELLINVLTNLICVICKI